MTLRHKTTGFVFREENLMESDKIFSVFTCDFGKIEIFGRAIRKIASKLKGNMEILSLSEIEFIQGKNKKILTDIFLKEKYENIKNNPEKIKIAYNIAGILNDFIRGEEKDENIFNLLTDIFNKLNNSQFPTSNSQLLFCYFFWNLIFVLGYGPEVSRCSICGKRLSPHGLYFSNKEGGIACRNCLVGAENNLKIGANTVKILRIILQKNWDILSVLKAGESDKENLMTISENYRNYLSFHYSRGYNRPAA